MYPEGTTTGSTCARPFFATDVARARSDLRLPARQKAQFVPRRFVLQLNHEVRRRLRPRLRYLHQRLRPGEPCWQRECRSGVWSDPAGAAACGAGLTVAVSVVGGWIRRARASLCPTAVQVSVAGRGGRLVGRRILVPSIVRVAGGFGRPRLPTLSPRDISRPRCGPGRRGRANTGRGGGRGAGCRGRGESSGRGPEEGGRRCLPPRGRGILQWTPGTGVADSGPHPGCVSGTARSPRLVLDGVLRDVRTARTRLRRSA